MRNRPSEVHLHLYDLMPPNCEQLRIPKAGAVDIAGFICDEDPLAFANDMDKIKRRNPLAIRPTAREIGLAVEAIPTGC